MAAKESSGFWDNIMSKAGNVLLVLVVGLIAIDRYVGRRAMTIQECEVWIPKCVRIYY